MIIVKTPDYEEALVKIAAHMINYMTGIKLFNPDGTISEEPNIKFPTLSVGNVEIYTKPSYGFIFVNIEDLKTFEKNLVIEMKKLFKSVKHTPYNDIIYNYHAVSNNVNCVLKVKPAMKLIRDSSDSRTKNAIVKFNTGPSDDYTNNKARFTWYIHHPARFNFEIFDKFRELAFIMHMISIIYDPEDIIDIPDGKFVHTFKLDHIKTYKNIINDFHMEELCDRHIPIWREIKPYYMNTTGKVSRKQSGTKGFRNLKKSVFSAKLSEDGKFIIPDSSRGNLRDDFKMEILPFKRNESNILMTDICGNCLDLLYSHNYALSMPIIYGKSQKCVLICPICMHKSRNVLEDDIQHIFRFESPRSVESMIEMAKCSYEKKNVLFYIMKNKDNIVRETPELEVSNILIGDEYILCTNLSEYIFDPASVKSNRKILTYV